MQIRFPIIAAIWVLAMGAIAWSAATGVSETIVGDVVYGEGETVAVPDASAMPVATSGNENVTLSVDTRVMPRRSNVVRSADTYRDVVADAAMVGANSAEWGFDVTTNAANGPTFGEEPFRDRKWEAYVKIIPKQLPEANGGSGTLTYTLTPDLPDGLKFDAATRTISGAPKSQDEQTTGPYTYTATDEAGKSATKQFNVVILEFVNQVPDLSGGSRKPIPIVVTQGIEVQRRLPAAIWTDGLTGYRFEPKLPEGVSFCPLEPSTVCDPDPWYHITGVFTETMTDRRYRYIAYDSDLLTGPEDEDYVDYLITVVSAEEAWIRYIEPAFRDVTISPEENVRLRLEVFGLQDLPWEIPADSGVEFTWSEKTVGESVTRRLAGNARSILYTAPSIPGRYTVTASLTEDHCTSTTPNEWKASDCTAEFEVVVKRPSASAAEEAAPINPPASAIPSILTDSDGNQYEVFTPEQGGTFAGEGYWVQADAGAVPNGEVIGIRMAAGGPADNSEMTAHRYTLGGSTYEIAAVDADGASVSGYVLEPNGLEVCVPLPDHLRGNVADASVVAHADDSLAILTSTVRINADGLLVCGTLSHLPATVAAGIEGSPKAPEAADDPTAPATGGAAPASGTPLLLLALGVLVGVIGFASIVAARRRRTVVGEVRG